MIQRGYSYVEVLVAVTLLALALPPAFEALDAGVRATGISTQEQILRDRLAARMENVLSQPYSELEFESDRISSATTPTDYSDPVGTADRLVVYLAGWDGDNADADNDGLTGADPHLLWVRVEIENSALFLQTLTTR